MNKNIFSYSFLYSILIFIGFFDLYSYYFFFGIEISSFVTTGEILTSFFSKTLIILPIIGFFFYARATENTSSKNMIQVRYTGGNTIVKELTFFVSNNNITLSGVPIILSYFMKILIRIFLWLAFLFYPLLIGWYLFYKEITYQLFIFDGSLTVQFMLLTIFVSAHYLNDKRLFSYIIVYGIIVCCFSYIGVINKEKARLIESGQPTHFVTYSIDSKTVATNENYLFIGVTKNYLFFRNTIDTSNSIVKIQEVKELRIKKIINSY